jgi:hypothetical protein
MASAYVQDAEYSSYISPIDLEAYQRNLFLMQGNFDKNEENLQQQINKLESVELAKESDRKYYRERLKKVVTDLNSSDFGNLAFNNTLNAMGAYASQAIDDVVLTAHAGTQAGKKIDLEYQAQKAKDPLSVSQTNYEYSKKDYNKWLQDERAGVVFKGNSTYIPNVDINKKIKEAVKTIEPGGFARVSANGRFEYLNESGEVITDTKVKQAIDALVLSDENVKKQVHINSWSEFKNVDDTNFVKIATEYSKNLKNYYTLKAKDSEADANRAGALGDAGMMNEYTSSAKYNARQATEWSKWTDVPSFNTRAEFDNYRDRVTSFIGEEKLKSTSADAFSYMKIEEKKIVANEAALTLKKQDEDKQFNYDKLAQEEAIAKRNYDFEVAKAVSKGEITPDMGMGMGMSQQMADMITSTAIATSNETNDNNQEREEIKQSVTDDTRNIYLKQLDDITSVYTSHQATGGKEISFPVKNANVYNSFAKENGLPSKNEGETLKIAEYKAYKTWQIDKAIRSGNAEALNSVMKSDMEMLTNITKGNSAVKLDKEQINTINKLNNNKWHMEIQTEGFKTVNDPKYQDNRGLFSKIWDTGKNIALNVGYKRVEVGDILNRFSAAYGGYGDDLFNKYGLSKNKDVRNFNNEDFKKLEKIVEERNRTKSAFKTDTNFEELKQEILAKREAAAPGAQGMRDELNKIGVVTNPQTNAFESSYLPMVYNAIQSSSSSDANVSRWKNMDYATFQKEVFRPSTKDNENPFKNAKVTYSNGKAFLNINDETKEQIDLGLLAGNNKFNQTINQFNQDAQAKKEEYRLSYSLYSACKNGNNLDKIVFPQITRIMENGKEVTYEIKAVPSETQIDFVATNKETKKSKSVEKISLSSYSENPEGLYSSVVQTMNKFK